MALVVETGVYKITNLVTQKVYIGSAISMRRRRNQHFSKLRCGRHTSIKLQNSFNKHGENAFKFEPILVCSKTHLLMYEQRAIDTFNSVKFGYNIAPIAGNSIGVKRSHETKLKLSAIAKAQWNDPEYRSRSIESSKNVWTPEKRKLQAERVTGTKYSEERKKAISIIGKKRYEDKANKEAQCKILDKARLSPLRKANVEAALKTPEYRAKQSEIMTAWWAKRKAEKVQ